MTTTDFSKYAATISSNVRYFPSGNGLANAEIIAEQVRAKFPGIDVGVADMDHVSHASDGPDAELDNIGETIIALMQAQAGHAFSEAV